MMTSKSSLHFPQRLDKAQRLMTSLILLLRVGGHLDIDSGRIKFLQSTIPVWSQRVANMYVRLASSRRSGTFGLVRESCIWHTVRAFESLRSRSSLLLLLKMKAPKYGSAPAAARSMRLTS